MNATKSLLLFAMLIGPLAAQTSPTMDGYVINDATGEPVTGAYATIQHGIDISIAAITETNGHFRLTGLERNTILSIRRPGFLEWRGGVAREGATESPALRIRLTPQAVIAGKLTDEDGFPVRQAWVSLVRVESYGSPNANPIGFVECDDLGDFRIAGLKAGRYYLYTNMMTRRTWDLRSSMQYYSGSPAGGTLQPLAAGVLEVKAGDERVVEFHAA